jgi:hypothetical protein
MIWKRTKKESAITPTRIDISCMMGPRQIKLCLYITGFWLERSYHNIDSFLAVHAKSPPHPLHQPRRFHLPWGVGVPVRTGGVLVRCRRRRQPHKLTPLSEKTTGVRQELGDPQRSPGEQDAKENTEEEDCFCCRRGPEALQQQPTSVEAICCRYKRTLRMSTVGKLIGAQSLSERDINSAGCRKCRNVSPGLIKGASH